MASTPATLRRSRSAFTFVTLLSLSGEFAVRSAQLSPRWRSRTGRHGCLRPQNHGRVRSLEDDRDLKEAALKLSKYLPAEFGHRSGIRSTGTANAPAAVRSQLVFGEGEKIGRETWTSNQFF